MGKISQMQATASLFTLHVDLPRVPDLHHSGNRGYSERTSPEVENEQQSKLELK